jgi:RecA-family ATPase
MSALEPLRVQRVAEIDAPAQSRPWLVRSLWASSAVGILGGPPKCGKTWLGLDLAISVASGTPCLGAFPVDSNGPTLVYLAEDSLDLESLDLYLITEPALRLDREADLHKLAAALTKLEPRLLLLDPFVRLHRRDENSSADVSGLLGDLRLLQRNHNLAIVLVHHVRKNGRGPQGEACASPRPSARMTPKPKTRPR